MHLPVVWSQCGALLDHDPPSWQVRVAFPTRIWSAAHFMVTGVPGGEAGLCPCVDPSTVNAGHSDEKWKYIIYKLLKN